MKNQLIMLSAIMVPLATAQGQKLTGEAFPTDKGDLVIHPILHSTLAMEWDEKVIYVDPYGGVENIGDCPNPTW